MEPGTRKVEGFRDLLWIGLFEFVGTTIFLAGIQWAAGNPAVIGCSIFIACIITGRVGGGQVNAAVTVAVYIVEYRHWKRNIPIAITAIIAQLAGGFFACCLKGLITGWDNLATLKSPDYGVYKTIWHVYIEEAMFTFLWISVILHTKYNNVSSSNDGVLNCLTIAFTLYGLVSMIADQTGACLNPTIGITFMLSEVAAGIALADKTIHLLLAYVFGPFTGGVFAALWLAFVGFKATPGDKSKGNRFTV